MPVSASSPGLSVVVPMHNEAGHVARLMSEIAATLRAHGVAAGGFEIIAVDDGSRDRTVEELNLAAASIPQLRVVRHPRNCGQSRATLSGAQQAAGSWIVTIDGDGQNDPADIAALLAARDQDGLAAVTTLYIGHRVVRAEGGGKPTASKIANAVRSAILGDRTPDSGCGLKLIRRDLLLGLPRFDALHRFMPALVIREGGSVISVPVRHRPRAYGRSHYGIFARGLIGLVDLVGVWWLMRRYTRPCRADDAP